MDEIKPILGIETSGSLCSICSYFSPEKYFELNINLKHSHAEKLFDLADTVVSLAGVPIENYDALAVSAGPGSFTGLRIGYSAAKGLAMGAEIPIIPVPTFEAFAQHLTGNLPEGSEFAIAVKVNTLEIYYARFYVKKNNYEIIENLHIITVEEFLRKDKNLMVFGNALQLQGIIRTAEPPASAIARWGQTRGHKLFEYDFLEPNYMKNFIIKEKQK